MSASSLSPWQNMDGPAWTTPKGTAGAGPPGGARTPPTKGRTTSSSWGTPSPPAPSSTLTVTPSRFTSPVGSSPSPLPPPPPLPLQMNPRESPVPVIPVLPQSIEAFVICHLFPNRNLRPRSSAPIGLRTNQSPRHRHPCDPSSPHPARPPQGRGRGTTSTTSWPTRAPPPPSPPPSPASSPFSNGPTGPPPDVGHIHRGGDTTREAVGRYATVHRNH